MKHTDFKFLDTDDLTGLSDERYDMLKCSFEGMSYQQIADKFILKTGTVKSRLNRIKEHIVKRRESSND